MAEETKNFSEEAVETVQTEEATVETEEVVAEETVEETVEGTVDEAAETEDAKEHKFFGKKKEKKDKKDEKIDELTDQVKRQMAEFDNYRKRTEKEKASMYIIGAKEVVEKILPVVDNFERGLAMANKGGEPSQDPFVLGMEKIYKQLMTTLSDLGVTPIEAVGKEFDANFHNAVMHVEDDSVGENIVVDEFQKGYLYKDFVVRYSMVKVAN